MTLHELNSLDPDLIRVELKQCCGADTWVRKFISLRPFADEDTLLRAADEIWFSLGKDDWLDAFAQHPKIGESSAAKWSSEEQRGMDKATLETAETMRLDNELYKQKFGWIFIVCATGKTAGEMRALLSERLKNSAAAEIVIAAREQSQITRLRLMKLLVQ